MMGTWVQCRCKALFTGDDEYVAWQKYQEHVESLVERGEAGLHGVIGTGKPVTYPEPPLSDLAATLQWVAHVVHQGHHETGGFERCSQITCMAAARALWASGHEIPMSEVLADLRGPSGVYCPDPSAHASASQQEGQG